MTPRIKFVLFLPFLVFSLFCLFRVPFGMVPDESNHFEYVRYLAVEKTLPSLDFLVTAHHPPLYYVLLSFFYAIFPNIYFLRLISWSFSLLNLYFIFKITDLVFPKYKNLSLATAVFCSLIPMYGFMSAGINNDALSNLLGSMIIFFTLLAINQKFQKKYLYWWAVTVAAATYTKIILYPLIALSYLVIFKTQKKQRGQIFLIFSLNLLLIFFWLLHNAKLYGSNDFLGWQKIKTVEKALLGNEMIRSRPREWLITVFHSLWGIFGLFSIYLPLPVYSVLRKLTGLLALLFAFFVRQNTKDKKTAVSLLLMAISFLLSFLALIKDNLTFFHPQGRYLFPVISIISFYYAASFFQLASFISRLIPNINKVFILYFLFYPPLLLVLSLSAKLIFFSFK